VRSLRLWTQLGAAATLAVVVWRLGAGPFLAGIRAVDARALLAAAAIGAVTTVCSAWRWTIVARGLGVPLSLRDAVAACYRSVFLNLTLPGGVAGDVHRGVSHGREAGDVGRALRAVAWERTAGQAVQALLTLPVLFLFASPVRSAMPLVGALALVAIAGVVLAGRAERGERWARLRRAVVSDVRAGLLRRTAWPAVALTSAVVVAGHAGTFLVATRSVGITASPSRLLPLALLALLAMVLPSVAGWGPREGTTAWVFGSAGLGADRGAATAVAYGVLVLAASLPGAAVLVAGWIPRPRPHGAVDA
jgi:glycosyltransferase 2 family protein